MRQLSLPIAKFDLLVAIFAAVILCGWWPGFTQSGLQLAVLDYGGPILFAASLFIAQKKKMDNWAIGMILVVCFASSAILSLKAYPVDLVHVVAACLAYIAIVSSLKDPKFLAKILITIGLINVIVALSQKIGFDPIYMVDPANNNIQIQHLSMPGFMGRNYHLGYYLLVTVPIAFYIKYSLGFIYFGLAALMTFLIGSFALYLSLAALIGYGLYKWYSLHRWLPKSILWIPVAVMAVCFVYTMPMSAVNNKIHVRSEVYAFSIKEIFTNPLVGHGLGSFERDTEVKGYGGAFNQPIKIAYELGLMPTTAIVMAILLYAWSIGPLNGLLVAAAMLLCLFPMFHETLRFTRLTALSLFILALLEMDSLDKRRA